GTPPPALPSPAWIMVSFHWSSVMPHARNGCPFRLTHPGVRRTGSGRSSLSLALNPDARRHRTSAQRDAVADEVSNRDRGLRSRAPGAIVLTRQGAQASHRGAVRPEPGSGERPRPRRARRYGVTRPWATA